MENRILEWEIHAYYYMYMYAYVNKYEYIPFTFYESFWHKEWK